MSTTSSPPVDTRSHVPLYSDLVSPNIRLITFSHTETETGLNITLFEVPLTKDLEFYALSYVWGGGLPKVTLRMNGYAFEVSQHLHDFLETMRDFEVDFRSLELAQRANHDDATATTAAHCGIPWWIDAICIDQSNIDERNRHVPRMSEIYSTASRVWVWFGTPEEIFPPDADLHTLMQVLNLAGENCQRETSDRESFLAQLGRLESSLAQSQVYKDTASSKEGKAPVTSESCVGEVADGISAIAHAVPSRAFLFSLFEQIGALARHDYFTRVWIMQEFILAKRVPIFIIGAWVFYLDVLPAAAFCLFEEERLLDGELAAKAYDVFRESKAAEWLSLAKYIPRQTNRIPSPRAFHTSVNLIAFLRLQYSSKATIDHDLFYGILGLLDEVELPLALQPDYRQSFEQVTLHYTRYLIENSKDLRIMETHERRLLCCPSWVPDMRHRIRPRDFTKPIPPAMGSVSTSADGLQLQVEGSMIGKILHCTCCEIDHDGTGDVLDFLRDVLFAAAARITNRTIDAVFGDWLSTFLKHPGTSETDFCNSCASLDEFREKFKELQYHHVGQASCPDHALHDAMDVLISWNYSFLLDSGDIVNSGDKRGTTSHLDGGCVWALKGSLLPTLLSPWEEGWVHRGNVMLMMPRRFDRGLSSLDDLRLLMLDEEYFAKRTVEKITLI
ncbi:heterokaryon incompatibility protein-domain-containing protein [Paraphoma chrysanthemicola]|nr:heterokaryon incompatibility protein-domain-containing protein [Paraphoma chrysanthemicola]